MRAVPAALLSGCAPLAGTEADTSRLTVTERRIGTAWFPASVLGAKRNVNRYLGYSDRTSVDRYDECLTLVTGQRHYYTHVRWDDGFQAFGSGTSRPVRIQGYSVSTAAASRKLNLPYKVGVGNSRDYLKARVGWMRYDGSRVFNDGPIYSRGGVYWFMNRENTRVRGVMVNPVFCD